MKKSTILLLSSMLAGSAFAQVVKAPGVAPNDAMQSAMMDQQSLRAAKPSDAQGHRRTVSNYVAKKSPMKVIAPPSVDDKVIDETPEGEMKLYAKEGFSYGYSWFTGMVSQPMYTALSNVVTSPDGKKMYIQNPVFFFYDSEENWIEGDVEGDILTIQLPQLISHYYYEYDVDNVEEYYDYLLKLEFVPEEEGSDTGWYYPTEDQTYRFKILADGSLESMEPDMMLGQCNWFDDEDREEGGYYYWQANGDIIYSARPVTEEPLEVPSSVEMVDWQLLTGMSYRQVQVGVDGEKMYIAGLYNRMPEAAVVGTISGDKVYFENSQYLGPYYSSNTLAYFLAGKNVVNVDSNGSDYNYFQISDDLVFDYDSVKKTLSSEGVFCISVSPTEVLYYVNVDKPYICVPNDDFTVTTLQSPSLITFFDVNEDYGWDAEIEFDFPLVDADRHILNTDYLFYEVIVDDEPYTFYDDTYAFPDGIEQITQIPYYFEDENIWVEDPDDEDGGYTIWGAISYYGIEHYVTLRDVRDFETLGVRTLYKNGDNEVYSDILWMPGYQPSTGVRDAVASLKAVDVRYFDMLGNRVELPAAGIFVRQTVYEDGSVKASKVRVR